MPLYYYKVIDEKNNIIRGKQIGENHDQIVAYFKTKNFVPIEIKKVSLLFYNLNDIQIFRNKIKTIDLAIISRQLYFIFFAGISINNGLELLQKTLKNQMLSRSLYKINSDILKGKSLSDSFSNQNLYSSFFISMIKIGELSGTLPEVFDRLATYYEETKLREEEIKNSLIYPIFLSVLMIFSVVLALLTIIPTYSELFLQLGSSLPLSTKILINTSDFIKNNILFLIFIIVFIIYIIYLISKTEKFMYFRDYFLSNAIFVKKLYLKILNYRFSSTLSTLYNSGVSIIDSLYVIKDLINNKFIGNEIDDIIIKVKQGDKLSTSLNFSKYFSSTLIDLLKVGEESGFVSESMEKCSLFLNMEISSYFKKINKFIEPVATIILGIILLFLMIAIILPTFSINFNF